jgi:hypothetical protein
VSKKNTKKFGSTWTCVECGKDFTHTEMMKHLSEVHKIDAKKVKGQKKMLAHMDAAEWFSSDYEWTIEGKKFLQSVVSERSDESKMYWM